VFRSAVDSVFIFGRPRPFIATALVNNTKFASAIEPKFVTNYKDQKHARLIIFVNYTEYNVPRTLLFIHNALQFAPTIMRARNKIYVSRNDNELYIYIYVYDVYLIYFGLPAVINCSDFFFKATLTYYNIRYCLELREIRHDSLSRIA